MASSGLLLRHLSYRPWRLKARPGGIRYPVSSTLHLRSSSSPKVMERGENLLPRPSSSPIYFLSSVNPYRRAPCHSSFFFCFSFFLFFPPSLHDFIPWSWESHAFRPSPLACIVLCAVNGECNTNNLVGPDGFFLSFRSFLSVEKESLVTLFIIA